MKTTKHRKQVIPYRFEMTIRFALTGKERAEVTKKLKGLQALLTYRKKEVPFEVVKLGFMD